MNAERGGDILKAVWLLINQVDLGPEPERRLALIMLRREFPDILETLTSNSIKEIFERKQGLRFGRNDIHVRARWDQYDRLGVVAEEWYLRLFDYPKSGKGWQMRMSCRPGGWSKHPGSWQGSGEPASLNINWEGLVGSVSDVVWVNFTGGPYLCVGPQWGEIKISVTGCKLSTLELSDPLLKEKLGGFVGQEGGQIKNVFLAGSNIVVVESDQIPAIPGQTDTKLVLPIHVCPTSYRKA